VLALQVIEHIEAALQLINAGWVAFGAALRCFNLVGNVVQFNQAAIQALLKVFKRISIAR
jgi:hypothetical protein